MKLVPDVEGLKRELFNEFLSQPGVLEQLKGIVKSVKEQRNDNAAPSKFHKNLSKAQSRSPRPPKSPLVSPRHSTTTQSSSAESVRHHTATSPVLTRVSPLKDEPYFSKFSPRYSVQLENTPSFCHESVSQISSPVLLDISKPNIESSVQSHQKIQTLSLKFSALNISSPTSASVGNNNIITNDAKTIDGRLDTESVYVNKEPHKLGNDESVNTSDGRVTASVIINKSSTDTPGNINSNYAIVNADVPANNTVNSDIVNFVDSRKATVDTNESRNATFYTNESRNATVDTNESRNATVDTNESRNAIFDTNESRNVTVDTNESRNAIVDTNESRNATVDNNESRNATVDTNESRNAIVDTNESRNATFDTNESRNAIVDTNESRNVTVDTIESRNVTIESRNTTNDTNESRNVTVDTNQFRNAIVDTIESRNATIDTNESVNISEAFKEISVSDFSMSLSLREEQSINLSTGTLDTSKFVTQRRRHGCSNLLELSNNVHNRKKNDKLAHVECNSECDHTLQKVGSEEIPQFFPYRANLAVIPSDLVVTIQDFFYSIGGHLCLENCGDLCEKLGLHSYLRTALFTGLGKQLQDSFTCTEFLIEYQAKARFLLKEDAELVAFYVISGFKPHVEKHHLAQIIMDIVMNHSYFEFCRSDFNKGKMLDHYKDTVVSSVLFAGDGWRQGKLTCKQFQKTQFLQCLNEVSSTEDLTRVPHFSYDQFYVIYSRFLNLDADEDFMLGKDELLDYDEYRILTDILVDRIFKVNLQNSPKGLMGYEDFVIFIKSEIDRFCPGSMHYWFNVLDLDDDGYLSFEELQMFYITSLQLILFSSKDIQSVSLTDMYTELTDTVYPSGVKHLSGLQDMPGVQDHPPTLCRRGYPKFSLHQLRNCHIFPHILDAFLNIFKFIDNDESCQSMLYNTDSKQVWNDYLDMAMKRIDAMMEEDSEST